MDELLGLEYAGERDAWVLAYDNPRARLKNSTVGGWRDVSCANIEYISVKQKQGPELGLAKLGCLGQQGREYRLPARPVSC